MKRFFKIVGKKKGGRHTGSHWWGVFGEVVFFSALFLSGVAFLATILMLDIQAIISGEWAISIGKSIRCFIGLLLISIGGYGIGQTVWTVGNSRERRRALVSLTRDVELLNEIGSDEGMLPSIPRFVGIGKHSGKKLRYSLQVADGSKLRIIANAALTIGFVIVSTVLVVHCVQSILSQAIDWPAILFATAHLAATAWQTYYFVRTLLRSSVFGPTIIEVDDVPIRLGDRMRIFFSQSGRLRVQCIEVELICEEKSTFNQGTDTRTETVTVFQNRLLRKRGVIILPERPFSESVEFDLPIAGMHSFEAMNNQVAWRIKVTCAAKGWPSLNRNFPIVVLPASSIVKESAA